MYIPNFIAAYTYHRNNTSQITDAPTIRSINFILQDEFDDWRDGEMLLQSLIETPEEVRDRILEAADYIPVAQLGTTDDCGFSPFSDDTSTLR